MTKRILFISSTRVGDAILSTGILDRLITDNPGVRVTIACGPAATSLFEAVPNLERIIVLGKMVFSLHWPMLWASCIGHYWDVVVDLRNSPMTYVLAAGMRRRIGRSRKDMHRVRFLGSVIGLEQTPPAPRLWVGGQHLEKAQCLIPDGSPVLAVGPTANWSAKTWPIDRFKDLSERLCGPDGILPGARIAILGLDCERPQALELINAIPQDRRIDLVGNLDLLDAYACLRRCAFYVGNDSGLMHLAAAARIPTLGLFGPSPEKLYAPWGDLCAVAHTSVPYDKIFPADFDHRNTGTLMESLSVDAAQEAACNLWEKAKEGGQ